MAQGVPAASAAMTRRAVKEPMRLCFSRYRVHGWGTLGRPMGVRRERSCGLWATEYEEHGVAMKMKSYCPEAVAETRASATAGMVTSCSWPPILVSTAWT